MPPHEILLWGKDTQGATPKLALGAGAPNTQTIREGDASAVHNF